MPTFRELAQKMLVRDEGLRLKPYTCTSGKLSLGIGRNIEDVGISKATAYQMLDEDLERCMKSGRYLFGPQWDTFPDRRKLGIINLIFNLGEEGFAKFKETIKLMKQERWQEACERLLQTKYATQVGSRAHRVVQLLLDESFPY